jgi:pimeloyl-ACP methyl ester carboxylesterase
MERREEETAMHPSEEREHLALAARLSGVDVEIVLPESNEMTREGMRLHYLDWGASTPDWAKPAQSGDPGAPPQQAKTGLAGDPGAAGRPPIVFLHGAALNAHTWDVVCLMLRAQHHCYALDQRGHGESAWAEDADYSGDAHRADIEAFVDHLGLSQFVLVGHSMGGFNAFHYAIHNSHRLAALVMVDAGPSMLIKGARRIVDFVSETAESDSLEQIMEKAMAFNPRRDPRLLRHSLLHNFRRTPSGKWVRKTDLRIWQGHSNRAREREKLAERFRQATPRVSCPTLIVQGGLSDVFTPEDAQEWAAGFPRARYAQVSNAGHTVQGDNPRSLAQALSQFLESLGGSDQSGDGSAGTPA